MLGVMDDEMLFPIGVVAERTGLAVKTIRFYSDKGLVPPSPYTPTGSTTLLPCPAWNWSAHCANSI